MSSNLEVTARLASLKAIELEFQFWFWGEALAFDAAALASQATRDHELGSRTGRPLSTWSRELLSRAAVGSDAYAPLSAMLHLYTAGRDAALLDAATKVAEYIISAPSHSGAHLHHLTGYPPMVFVDFIYYAGPYLGQLAKIKDDERYIEEAVRQTLGHLETLRDAKTGLVHHVYDPGRDQTNGVAWGRGNGWAMLGLVDTLCLIPEGYPGRKRIHAALLQMVDTCVSLQAPNGKWHTILDDFESPLENSVAAFFYAALSKAQRYGLLTRSVSTTTALAWSAVLDVVGEDGSFPISMTEWPDWDPIAYYRRPIGVNAWGQGCFVRAVVEHLEQSDS